MSHEIKEASIKDQMWYATLQEMNTHAEDEGLFTRVVLMAGVDRGRIAVQAEIWDTRGPGKSARLHTWSREWPHPDAKELPAACFQACVKVWQLYHGGEEVAKRPTKRARGHKLSLIHI